MTTPTNPVIRKFTALLLDAHRDSTVTLSHGRVEEGWARDEFDTEEEAIAHAFSEYKYGTWMIVPIIRFDMWPGDYE